MASMNVEQMKEELSSWSVMDVTTLVKALEEHWGVSAAAPVAVAAAGPAPAAAEEKDSFDVELTDAGSQKVKIIKAVKDLLAIGLGEAKALTGECPKVIKEGVSKDEAAEIKKTLEEAGAKVTLK